LNEVGEKVKVHIEGHRTLRVIIVVALIVVIVLLRPLQQNSNAGNVSAVDSIGIGVYWNRRCTQPVTAIDWGTLLPGGQKSFVVYLRNLNTTVIRFTFSKTQLWDPANAASYMQLSFNHTGQQMDVNRVYPVTLTLHVSSTIVGITSFTFNIVICGSPYFAGDVDHDGDVDPKDFAFFGSAFGTTPNDAAWNPNADFDDSGKVDPYDFMLLSANYGK
jgi:hypothetical protein